MRRFDYSFLKDKAWDNEIVGYLSQIHEQKGKQVLYLRQKPADVEKLIEIAKIQSTESSNEIEGIRTTDTRLRQLMSEKTTPRTRDEKEIAGYRDALNTVHENFEYIPLTPNYILQLHKIMFSHTDSAFGGSFKNVQNYISATTADGRTYALFTPLAPYETPEAMRELCDAYNFAVGEGKRDENGKIIPMTLKENDKVLFTKWSGTEVKINDETLLVMKENDVIALIEE